jgi:hypothetical protein
MTKEDFTNEILELRQDINLLTDAMMKRRKMTATAHDVTEIEAVAIRDARELIQELIDAL